MPGPLVVEVEPWGPDPDVVEAAARAALERSTVKAALGGSQARLLSVQPLDEDYVRATVYDYAAERALLVDVPLGGDRAPVVTSTAQQPVPTPEEREAAVAVLREHEELGPALSDGRLVPYPAMPPLLEDEREDGTVERTVTVGLRPARGEDGHEIVAVRLARGEVVRFEAGAPPGARAAHRRCGVPDAGQATTMSRAGAARITVTRDGERLWRLIAVRPAASSGRDGSGVELRSVAYRGKRVLRRAHVPILNVRYDGDACGPFRDWQNEESRFQAEGAAVAPGFRLCPEPATTILESRRDRGNFAGVAVFVDGEEVELVSELAAGWYRYISRWRLHANGTIRARFGFDAVDDSCVCAVHHHHAYWRLDFDIAGAGDDMVLEYNDPPLPGHDGNWHTLRHEVRRPRNQGRERRWRVKNRGTGEGYLIVPGTNDGEADSYGRGDFWALRRRRGQIDDYPIGGDTRAHLDRFVNRESIVGTDVVVWYVGHFSHDVAHDHADGGGHIVGPTLRPDGW